MSQNLIGEDHPLSLMALSLPEGELGAILSRPGMGKTAVLVQLAIYHLLSGANVLHVSLDQSVRKVALWYEEVFTPLALANNWQDHMSMWETMLPRRFIMGFTADGFSASRLMERLNDLTEQNIFYPQVMIVDGLDFSEGGVSLLKDMKALVGEYKMRAWFSMRLKKDESIMEDGLPGTFSQVADLFFRACLLAPENGGIAVQPVKNGIPADRNFILDPATFLIGEAGR